MDGLRNWTGLNTNGLSDQNRMVILSHMKDHLNEF